MALEPLRKMSFEHRKFRTQLESCCRTFRFYYYFKFKRTDQESSASARHHPLSRGCLTLTALRMDPMMNFGADSGFGGSSGPFCTPSSCPFCWCSGRPKGHVISMSPSSKANFSPLKFGFSYRTHLETAKRREGFFLTLHLSSISSGLFTVNG